MYFKFEAVDGYIQYDPANTGDNPPYRPWDPSWPKIPCTGLGMDYAQHWFMLSPGVEIFFKSHILSLSFSFTASSLVLCFSFDNHYARVPPFLAADELFGGFYLEPKGTVSFTLGERFEIGLSASYRYISGTRGDSTYREYDPSGTVTTTYLDIAGAGFKALKANVFFKYTF
jgi:outer membrane protease